MGKEVELSLFCSSKRKLEAGLACFQQRPTVIHQAPKCPRALEIQQWTKHSPFLMQLTFQWDQFRAVDQHRLNVPVVVTFDLQGPSNLAS